MTDTENPIVRLLKEDPRYQLEAYQFVREGLTYAQEIMMMGSDEPAAGSGELERHLTGQQLCEAIRKYAIDQFGYMANVVLSNWGIRETRDIGNIVYNLIDVDLMKRSANDKVEDFDNVYSFEEAFQLGFEIDPDGMQS